MDLEILHLSSVIGSPLLDRAGDRIGRVADCIVWLNASPHPPISGLVASLGGRELFVPIAMVSRIDSDSAQLSGETLNLKRFERRSGELLLARDLSGRHLINLVGARLIRAHELELAHVEGAWRVVGVDPSPRASLRRVLPRRLKSRILSGAVVDWASIEPFVSHVPSARMRIPYRKLSRLRAAQIADLVEAASHEEGEEIIEAVGMNRALEADVFEELGPEHQREFLNSRSVSEAARLLSSMEPDDAADLITDLDQERRLPLLEALPKAYGAKVRALLSYNPETAGGLMSPDFLSLPADTTVPDALEAVRKSEAPPEALATIYVTDEGGRLYGVASLVSLLKASDAARLGAIGDTDPLTIRADADLHAIVRKMSDFDLSSAPVVDNDRHMLGIITVDDVLELMLPTGWRRDFGMTTADG